MNHWLGIALVAYLMGAALEGVSTASQLSQKVPELAKGTQDNPDESDAPPTGRWQIFAAIASVSICGACVWPCRLLHRSIKGKQDCQKD
ncbi:hypothetical protein [Brasilonema bromeliae]|uniref:Uncharacterized protein n=1 Tax=Brasilonema bromeliae SPC951 TaxID=385972 RepID=A0ABX1P3R9_9CYAN|nr:hypothetical protein [Brasilonema bromeliae]NMG18212.1 hypothetical protein [Brasilonema bromeliae SPC951]